MSRNGVKIIFSLLPGRCSYYRAPMTKAVPSSCLVPVRSQGERVPILVLHGMQCDTSFATMLARSLPRDQPVYALKAAGLDGGEAPMKTIEAMAARYMAEAEAIVRGRYVLAGFCAGMAIAKQIGHFAAQYGGTAQRLFIIDAARTTRTAQFAQVARQQIQVAKLRPTSAPRYAEEYRGGEQVVKAFVKALVRWDRAASRQPYPHPAEVIATEETRPSMIHPDTGWEGILPPGTPLTIVGAARGDLLGIGLPRVAAAIYASTAP